LMVLPGVLAKRGIILNGRSFVYKFFARILTIPLCYCGERLAAPANCIPKGFTAEHGLSAGAG